MSKFKILTIDDDPEFNNLIKLYLKKADAEVVTTERAEDFLAQLKIFSPDICLIDLNLDKAYGAGFQLIKAIRKNLGQEVVLFAFSKRSSRLDIDQALEFGANEYLLKPFDEVSFFLKLSQYIRLDQEKIPTLKYFEVSSIVADCAVDIDLTICGISESTLTLKSPHRLSKGAFITLSGEVINEIFLKEQINVVVDDTQIQGSDSISTIKLAELDSKTKRAVKKFIATRA